MFDREGKIDKYEDESEIQLDNLTENVRRLISRIQHGNVAL